MQRSTLGRRFLLLAGLIALMLTAVACDTAPVDDDTNDMLDAVDIDVDPCSGITNPCVNVGIACLGDASIVCARDAQGCLVETRTSCTEAGEVCSPSTGQCVADPCADLPDACDAPNRVCQGDVLTVCAPNPQGCLVAAETDCSEDGESCVNNEQAQCTGGMCTNEPDCTLGERYCDGDTLVYCESDPTLCRYEDRFPCDMGFVCTENQGLASCTEPCVTDPECASSANGDAACVGDTIETCVEVEPGCLLQVVTNCGIGTCETPSGTPQCSVAGEFYVGVNTVFETEPMFFTPLMNNDAIPVTAGFQGTWMVVIAFKTRALLSGAVDIEATVRLDGMEVGSLQLNDQPLVPGGDGYDYYYNFFVDMGIFDPPMMGTPIEIDVHVVDDLGVFVDQTITGTVGEHIFL